MKLPLSLFARLGLSHHKLYARALRDPDEHVTTLEALLRRTDIETLDCCLPDGRARQERLVRAIQASNLTRITFAVQRFPYHQIAPTSNSPSEIAQVREHMENLVHHAATVGATGFVFASGGPPVAQASAAHHRAFNDHCRWLCERLAPHGIDALLEPVDFDVEKHFLYGPLDRTLELAENVSADFPNFGLVLDVAHLRLMREPLAAAIRRASPWLKRIHLGNCMIKDPTDPCYGDQHPPLGYPGGEINEPELNEILTTLIDVGYLRAANRGDLVLKITPFPDRSVDASIRDNLTRVQSAWNQVAPSRKRILHRDGVFL